MTDIGFVNVEVLSAANTKVLAINNTRVSRVKGYGLMTPIATFGVAVSDILNALDVQPVKHGRWSECYTDTHHYSGICSVCGRASIKSLTETLYGYCPRCGARMDGDTE